MQTSGKENLFSFSRVQIILCKDNANERKENLFSFSRDATYLMIIQTDGRTAKLTWALCRVQIILLQRYDKNPIKGNNEEYCLTFYEKTRNQKQNLIWRESDIKTVRSDTRHKKTEAKTRSSAW